MTTFLNHDNRNTLVQRILDHKYGPLFAAIKKNMHALGVKIYEKKYDAETRRTINSLPEGWLPKTRYILVYFNGIDYSLEFEEPVRILTEDVRGRFMDVSDQPLVEEGTDIAMREKDLKEERRTMNKQIRARLAGFLTLEKLVEDWPEIKSFTTDLASPPKNLPAVTDLNKKLDLPPKK